MSDKLTAVFHSYMNGRGRVVIPHETRSALGIESGTLLEIKIKKVKKIGS